MRDFKGKTAFITGGAGGFGRAFAKVFLREGMNVALSDLDAGRLAAAEHELEAPGRTASFVADVSDRAALARAADGAIARFGPIHLVCNNAGIAGKSDGLEALTSQDWAWLIDVDLMSVVHGISIFLPHMRAHGQGGHFLNTASMAGVLGQPQMGPYCATKAGVVSLTETLRYEVRGTNISAGALCPGFARTGITEARDNPHAPGTSAPRSEAGRVREQQMIDAVKAGMSAQEVAERAFVGIRDDDLYIFTHPEMRALLEPRLERLRAAYDKAAAFRFIG